MREQTFQKLLMGLLIPSTFVIWNLIYKNPIDNIYVTFPFWIFCAYLGLFYNDILNFLLYKNINEAIRREKDH